MKSFQLSDLLPQNILEAARTNPMKEDTMLQKGQSIAIIDHGKFGDSTHCAVKYEHKTHHLAGSRLPNGDYNNETNHQSKIKRIHSHKGGGYFDYYTHSAFGSISSPVLDMVCKLDLTNNVKRIGWCSVYYYNIDLKALLEIEKDCDYWCVKDEPFPYPEKVSARHLLLGLVEPVSEAWYFLMERNDVKQAWVRDKLIDLDEVCIDPKRVPREFAQGKINLSFLVGNDKQSADSYETFTQIWLGKYLEIGHRNDFLNYAPSFQGFRHPRYVKPYLNRIAVPENEANYWIKKWEAEDKAKQATA